MKRNAELSDTFLCLYLQRRTHQQIAAATGLSIAAIEQRICRGKLRKKRDDIEKCAIPKVTIEQRSEATKAVMASQVQKSAEALEEIPHSKNVTTAKERADLVQTVAQTAKIVFDWNAPNSGPTHNVFNFALLDSARLDESNNGAGATTVIDITPVNGHHGSDENHSPTLNGAGARRDGEGQGQGKA